LYHFTYILNKMYTTYIFPASFFALIAIPAARGITISPPKEVPSAASGPIDPSFVGFGIETSSFPDYTGQAINAHCRHRVS
jgi:hypothetical protein